MGAKGGIGDYIHLKLDSYQRGLAVHETKYQETSERTNESKALKAIKDQHAKLYSLAKSIGNEALARKVGTELNNIFNENRNKDYQAKYDAMINAAAENTGLDANIVTQLLSSADSTKVSKQFSRWQLRKKANETMETMKQIKNLLNNLNKRIIAADKNNKGVQADIQAKLQGILNIKDMNTCKKDAETGDDKLIKIFNKELGNVKTAISAILTVTNESMKTLGGVSVERDKLKEWTPIKNVTGATETSRGSITVEIGGELFTIPQDQIVKALAAINGYINAIAITTKIIGDIAEYGLGGLACFLENVEENMSLYVLGGERGRVTYDTSNFTYFDAQGKPVNLLYNEDPQSALFDNFTMFEQNSNQYLRINSAPSQNKVDVKFTSDILRQLFPKDTKITQDMNMSVKAYKRSTASSKGFGGVGGSSFLYLVQSEMPDFVNHWINLTIAHEEDKKFPSESTEVQQAHTVMRQTLIVIGAIGGTLKTTDSGTVEHTDSADYLVWKDTTSNQDSWHVYSMYTVLKPVLENIKNPALKKYVEGYDDLINSNSWKTSFVSADKEEVGITKRLQNILVLLHQSKITTHTPMPIDK